MRLPQFGAVALCALKSCWAIGRFYWRDELSAYRWARHRVVDAAGSDKVGLAAISMWWIARAAAEETLQGAPLAAAWLKLFRTQLSVVDTYWLRWRGDFAESAELRRAYSGLYGRFFARALLAHHFGHSRFLSLKRNGLVVPGSVHVRRIAQGDMPDWLAWDDRRSRFVLGEAKGSLTARDFLLSEEPKCVANGKAQFDRVETYDGNVIVQPAQWVAATRWATDARDGDPVTILWDPPGDDEMAVTEEPGRHREAMTRAWLESIAQGMGWENADALLSKDRAKEAISVRAPPGSVPEVEDWPTAGDVDTEAFRVFAARQPSVSSMADPAEQEAEGIDELLKSKLYPDPRVLQPPSGETDVHQGDYISAAITRFGVRPIQSKGDYKELLRMQDAARAGKESAVLVGIPINIDLRARRGGKTWLDGAGIAQPGDLSLFDLRRVALDR